MSNLHCVCAHGSLFELSVLCTLLECAKIRIHQTRIEVQRWKSRWSEQCSRQCVCILCAVWCKDWCAVCIHCRSALCVVCVYEVVYALCNTMCILPEYYSVQYDAYIGGTVHCHRSLRRQIAKVANPDWQTSISPLHKWPISPLHKWSARGVTLHSNI